MLYKVLITFSCKITKNITIQNNVESLKKKYVNITFHYIPFEKTLILEPLSESSDLNLTNAKQIFTILEKTNYDSSCTYEMFMNELHLI